LLISRWFRLALIAFLLTGRFVAAYQNPGAEHPGAPEYSRADIEAGARIYIAKCAGCHGADGDQVGAVNLRSGQFRRAATDQELMRLISTGIPGPGMPANKLPAVDMSALVAFLRNMREFDARSVRLGDAAQGRALFDGRGGCRNCHRVSGNGPHVGPDLSDIGLVRSASQLERSIMDPSAGLVPINRPIRVLGKDGRVLTGRRVNEDTFVVLMMTDDERLVAIEKSDIRDFKVMTQAKMPAFKDKLSPEELSDITAYLVSLKGEQ
jgi:putative heme-binding domain-containing protein